MKRAALLIPMLLVLVGCMVGGVDVEQEQASGLAGELLDSHSLGQTFTLQYDGLYRIDLYTATYARDNTHPVIFRIKAAPDADQDLIRTELSATQISNSGPTVITFPSLAGTAGKTLYLSVESPGSMPGDAITIYRHEEDVYPAGQMFIDGQPAEGDLAFIAYTQESFSITVIWDDFYSRASQDRPFFAFYCSLLALLLVALGITLAWRPRRQAENGSPSTTHDEQPPTGDPVAPAETTIEETE